MDKNQELTQKLEREIWLFEQWLASLADQQGETQERIRQAYEDCIRTRQNQLDELKAEMRSLRQNAQRITESA